MKSHNATVHKKILANTPIFRAARRSDISTQIRSVMLEKGLKNVDLADRLGVSEANISRWLRGNQNLSLDTLYQLADAVEEPLRLTLGAETTAAKSTSHDLYRDEFVKKLGRELAMKAEVAQLNPRDLPKLLAAMTEVCQYTANEKMYMYVLKYVV